MAGTRATWKGLLQLALIQIPIKVFPATESSDALSFHQLHEPCQARIQQVKRCPSCRRDVPQEEIVKGFEVTKGQYVLLLADELDAVKPPSTRVIDLVQFAPATMLEHTSIDRAYYLAPDGPAAGAAYAVLREALSGMVGIGKLAIYGREYLVAVCTTPGNHTGLMLYTLHQAAEIRPIEAIDAMEDVRAAPLDQVRLARLLVTAFTRPLDLTDFCDEYKHDVQRLIAAKVAGCEFVAPPLQDTPVMSLADALRDSLAALTAKKTPAKAHGSGFKAQGSAAVVPKRKRAS